jgi:probable rRNA maturation factor
MAVSVAAPRGLSGLLPPLRALVAVVLRGERRRLGEVGILLADDARLRELNREWRGIDRATDVISFAYDETEADAASRPVRGDLAVSLDRVHAQARRYRVTPGAELARLVAHGTLHLCGHDHARAAERAAMRAREATALRGGDAIVRALDRALAAAAGRAARDGTQPPR